MPPAGLARDPTDVEVESDTGIHQRYKGSGAEYGARRPTAEESSDSADGKHAT
jgi:hypothetical protein